MAVFMARHARPTHLPRFNVDRIHARLRARKVRQVDVARELGIDHSRLSAILYGRAYVSDATHARVVAILAAFGITEQEALLP
jgi:transcriptional regulator with XRE-family HTH domain